MFERIKREPFYSAVTVCIIARNRLIIGNDF